MSCPSEIQCQIKRPFAEKGLQPGTFVFIFIIYICFLKRSGKMYKSVMTIEYDNPEFNPQRKKKL